MPNVCTWTRNWKAPGRLWNPSVHFHILWSYFCGAQFEEFFFGKTLACCFFEVRLEMHQYFSNQLFVKYIYPANNLFTNITICYSVCVVCGKSNKTSRNMRGKHDINNVRRRLALSRAINVYALLQRKLDTCTASFNLRTLAAKLFYAISILILLLV